ncbi:MAG: bifunctional riboflavin kinase/FAD synthetase [Ignavibacteriales bacterium]|nr:bifunctional riboflavin kinase/FAD synthetase [Ignavibacteriales bacterium]
MWSEIVKVYRNIADVPHDNNSVITVGTFDGMHRAHRAILAETIAKAKAFDGRSVLVTFNPHPREIIFHNGRPIELLTSLEERIDLCRELGIDVFVVLPFDTRFSQLSARTFYRQYLFERIGMRAVVLGSDHRFGHNREGSKAELLSMSAELGVEVRTIDQIVIGGEPVSSTRIRRALTDGKPELANTLLDRPYELGGVVVHGNQRGRTLGYPTANIEPHSSKKLVPKNGVYLSGVVVRRESYFGLMSIGVRPTFYEQGKRIVEVYILDFDADIYDEPIRVSLLRRLRDELKFDSVGSLISQMDNDKAQGLRLISEIEIQKTH